MTNDPGGGCRSCWCKTRGQVAARRTRVRGKPSTGCSPRSLKRSFRKRWGWAKLKRWSSDRKKMRGQVKSLEERTSKPGRSSAALGGGSAEVTSGNMTKWAGSLPWSDIERRVMPIASPSPKRSCAKWGLSFVSAEPRAPLSPNYTRSMGPEDWTLIIKRTRLMLAWRLVPVMVTEPNVTLTLLLLITSSRLVRRSPLGTGAYTGTALKSGAEIDIKTHNCMLRKARKTELACSSHEPIAINYKQKA